MEKIKVFLEIEDAPLHEIMKKSLMRRPYIKAVTDDFSTARKWQVSLAVIGLPEGKGITRHVELRSSINRDIKILPCYSSEVHYGSPGTDDFVNTYVVQHLDEIIASLMGWKKLPGETWFDEAVREGAHEAALQSRPGPMSEM